MTKASQLHSAKRESAGDGLDQLSAEYDAEKGEEVANTRHLRRPISRGHVLVDVERLYRAGFACVPLCAPLVDGRCSAPWHPQPCTRAGKRPLHKGFPALASARPELGALLRNFFAPFSTLTINVGIVVPRGFFVIEADSPAATIELVSMIDSATTAMRGARPGRGPAWIFQLPDDAIVHSRRGLGTSGAIDIVGAGGILVAPPSMHVSGHIYSWEQSPIDVPITLASPMLVEFQMRHPARVRRRPTRVTVHVAASDAGRPDPIHLPSYEERLVRATAYVARMDPAIQGQNGSDACFRAALAAVRGFCLSSANALSLLRDSYNKRCAPPWSVEELMHKIRSAESALDVPWAYLMPELQLRTEPDDLRPGGNGPARAAGSPPLGQVAYESVVLIYVERHASKIVLKFAFELDPSRGPRPRLVLDFPPNTDRALTRWRAFHHAAGLAASTAVRDLLGTRVRIELIGPNRRVGRVFPPITTKGVP